VALDHQERLLDADCVHDLGKRPGMDTIGDLDPEPITPTMAARRRAVVSRYL
jgi:hypothetical protein